MFYIILFLLLFFFVLMPIFKIGWYAYRLRRRWQQATSGMRGGQPGNGRSDERPTKKKKIDPSVGEYVSFEEIACNTTIETSSQADSGKSYTVESQVEDAVWEEIK